MSSRTESGDRSSTQRPANGGSGPSTNGRDTRNPQATAAPVTPPGPVGAANEGTRNADTSTGSSTSYINTPPQQNRRRHHAPPMAEETVRDVQQATTRISSMNAGAGQATPSSGQGANGGTSSQQPSGLASSPMPRSSTRTTSTRAQATGTSRTNGNNGDHSPRDGGPSET